MPESGIDMHCENQSWASINLCSHDRDSLSKEEGHLAAAARHQWHSEALRQDVRPQDLQHVPGTAGLVISTLSAAKISGSGGGFEGLKPETYNSRGHG